MTKEELEAELGEVKEMITAVNGAIKGNVAGGIKSYEIDTAAGKRELTKISLGDLIKLRESLYGQRSALESRLESADSGGVEEILFRFD